MLGLTIEDWASLIGVVGSISGIVFYLFRVIVVKPMSDKSQALNSAIESLTKEVRSMQQQEEAEHENYEGKLHSHDIQLARHEEEIKTLFRHTDDN